MRSEKNLTTNVEKKNEIPLTDPREGKNEKKKKTPRKNGEMLAKTKKPFKRENLGGNMQHIEPKKANRPLIPGDNGI